MTLAASEATAMAARAGRNFEGIRLLQSLQKNRSSQSNPGDPNVPNVHQWDVKRAEVRHWAGLIEAAFEHARFIRQGAGAADDYGARVTAETAERWEGLATAARDEFRSLAACRAAAQLPAGSLPSSISPSPPRRTGARGPPPWRQGKPTGQATPPSCFA